MLILSCCPLSVCTCVCLYYVRVGLRIVVFRGDPCSLDVIVVYDNCVFGDVGIIVPWPCLLCVCVACVVSIR